MNEIEKLAYRAKEILGSKIADLTEIEAKAFYDLANYFRNKIIIDATEKTKRAMVHHEP